MTACATQQKQYSIFEIEKQASKAYVSKKWKVAEQKYSELISRAPGTAEIWFRLGNIYAHTKRPAKAVLAYQEAVVRQPEYDKAWHNMGIVSLQQTTSIFLEMLNHLKPDSERYRQAKKTAEELVKILETRRKNTKQPVKAVEIPQSAIDTQKQSGSP